MNRQKALRAIESMQGELRKMAASLGEALREITVSNYGNVKAILRGEYSHSVFLANTALTQLQGELTQPEGAPAGLRKKGRVGRSRGRRKGSP